jgi:hypothetical protein
LGNAWGTLREAVATLREPRTIGTWGNLQDWGGGTGGMTVSTISPRGRCLALPAPSRFRDASACLFERIAGVLTRERQRSVGSGNGCLSDRQWTPCVSARFSKFGRTIWADRTFRFCE